MSDRPRYSPPYYDSYDDIAFNMEKPGGGFHSRCTSRAPTPTRYTSPRRSAPPSSESLHDDLVPPRRVRLSTPEEDAYFRHKIASKPKIPSYTDALVTSSRRLRQRAMSPPIVVPEEESSYIKMSLRNRSASADRLPPPAPLHKPRVVASECYRKQMRSIFDRQPLFQDFLSGVNDDEKLGFYNLTDIYRMKSNFKGLLKDKYKKMTYKDPSIEYNIGRKLLPWNEQIKRDDDEPASVRIARDHESRRVRVSTSPIPRLTVYHRSTTPQALYT